MLEFKGKLVVDQKRLSRGAVWALGEVWCARKQGSFRIAVLILGLLVILTVTRVTQVFYETAENVLNHESTFEGFRTLPGSDAEVFDRLRQSGELVRAGNVNVTRGGPVWRKHSQYYGFK